MDQFKYENSSKPLELGESFKISKVANFESGLLTIMKIWFGKVTKLWIKVAAACLFLPQKVKTYVH